MRTTTVPLCLVLLVLLSGCDSLTVRVDYDTTASFAGLQTYGWAPPMEPLEPAQIGAPSMLPNPIINSEVRNVIEAQLAERGYARVTGAPPDFLVGFYVTVRDRIDVESINSRYGYKGTWSHSYYYGYPAYTRTRAYYYQEGTLIVDISTPDTKQLIWRGEASADVTYDVTPEQRNARLNKAVSKMLDSFPPQAGGQSVPRVEP